MKKVIYIISHVQKSLAFEWIAEGLKDKYDLKFILLNYENSSLEDSIRNYGLEVKRFYFKDKRNSLSVFLKLLQYIKREKPDVVHAHLLDAQLLGLTASWLAGVKKRIYTRHNSNFHHVYFPKGVKYDLWSNKLATKIISISQATYNTLSKLERVPDEKIKHIPHGFDLNIFDKAVEKNITAVKQRWSVPSRGPRIGVIARHIEWKGIQYIINAFRRLLVDHPSSVLILANAYGPYSNHLSSLLQPIPSENYLQISFEEDVASLYRQFDIYVHTPVDELCEAFGQTYVEALASGVPSIFTKSGIAAEFIEHEVNALVVDFRNSDMIYEAIKLILNDNNLRVKLIENGKKAVALRFNLQNMLTSLSEIYDD